MIDLQPPLPSPRRIAHLDMDMFFAGVELLQYPELRGQPVVVGGRSAHAPALKSDGSRHFYRLREYTGRGVVTTSTYEARALGVFSAMGLMQSGKLAPEAILLPANFDAYRHYSRLFKQAVIGITPHIEDRGIDEIYIDLTQVPGDSREIGLRIKKAVRDATQLSCSICIAPNKLLAKIGSELDKPDGLTLLTEASIPERIWPLPVSKINGIGPKAAKKLAELDIHTILQLAHADAGHLQAHFGLSYARWLMQVAHGRDSRPVVTHTEPKSLSRETTFERDMHPKNDKARLSEIFTRLCTRLSEDLQEAGYVGKTISIKLKYQNFTTATRDLTLPEATQDATVIRRAAGECLKRAPLDKRLRLLGVRVSTLLPKDRVKPAGKSVQAELAFDVDAEKVNRP